MTEDSGSLFVCRAVALNCPVRSKVLLSCVGVFCSLALLGLLGPGSPATTETAELDVATVSESQELAWVQVTHEHVNYRFSPSGRKQLGQDHHYPAGAPAYE